MNDYKISIWYYTYCFCRRFDGKVVAYVYDNARNMGASFSKTQNLHCIDDTKQLRVKGIIRTVYKSHTYFYWMIYHKLNERDNAAKNNPLSLSKSKAKQLLDFVTAFQDKLN